MAELDDAARVALLPVLREAAARGAAVLVTAQSPAEAESYADRILPLSISPAETLGAWSGATVNAAASAPPTALEVSLSARPASSGECTVRSVRPGWSEPRRSRSVLVGAVLNGVVLLRLVFRRVGLPSGLLLGVLGVVAFLLELDAEVTDDRLVRGGRAG